MQVKLIYSVIDEVLYQEFVDGVCGSRERWMSFNLTELSKQARRNILELSQMSQNSACQGVMDSIWIKGSQLTCVRVWLSNFALVDGCHEDSWGINFNKVALDHAIETREEFENMLSNMLTQLTELCCKNNPMSNADSWILKNEDAVL